MIFDKLFSEKNKFQEGMIAGSKPFEEKFRKQEAAIERVGKEVKDKLDDISSVNDIIINELSMKQKKEIYDLNTKYDIAKTLNQDEKEFLASTLITIANGVESINEYQQDYIRSILKYINVLNPQSYVEISSIENIENINIQKSILQTLMEFLFLENQNHDYINYNKELFSYFSVNSKAFFEIKTSIDNIYKATGCKGISEKYGFVDDDVEIELFEDVEFDKESWENFLVKLHPYCDKSYHTYGGYIENAKHIKDGYKVIKNRVYYLEEIKTSYGSINIIKSRLIDGTKETILLEDIGFVRMESFVIKSVNSHLIVHSAELWEPFCYFINTNDENTYKIENCKTIHFLGDEYMLFSSVVYNYPSRWVGAEGSSIKLMKYIYKTNRVEVIDEYIPIYNYTDNFYQSRESFAFYNDKMYYFTFSMDGRGDFNYTLRVLDPSKSENKSIEVKKLPTFDYLPRNAYFTVDKGYLYYIIDDSLNKMHSYMLTAVKQ